MNYRRLVTATSGVGALAIAAIMVLSPLTTAGVARPASFPGAIWNPSVYRGISGCAQSHAFPAHWSAVTGVGKQHGSTFAKTCPAYRGGSFFGSSGYADQYLNVYAPAAMMTGTGGINVSWSLKMVGGQSTSMSGGWACPTTTYSANYWWGYTWYNFTDTYSYCSLEAYLDVYGYTYLWDQTTSTYFYSSNYWTGIYNSSIQYNDTYMYTANYSNSSYWAYNYSYSGSYNYSYGGAGVISGTYTPQWFINGTFVSTDSYQVITSIYVFQSSYVYGFTGPNTAKTSVNMGGVANHENLLPFSIW